MSTSVPLGIVSLKAEGAYSADKLYKKGMWVTSSGSSYAYINPTPSTGVPLSDTTHWQQIASVGGQELVDAAVAAKNAAVSAKDQAQMYASRLDSVVATPAKKSVSFFVGATTDIEATKSQINTALADGANMVSFIVDYHQALKTDNQANDMSDENYTRLASLVAFVTGKGLSAQVRASCVAQDGAYLSIEPSDEPTWVTNWQTRMMRLSAVIYSQGARYLSVSNENRYCMDGNTTQWAALVSAIHGSYPEMQVGVDVNAFTYSQCIVYDKFDYIGYNLYPCISSIGLAESEENMRKAFWNDFKGHNHVGTLEMLHRIYNKPVWVTEVGCVPYTGALAAPYSQVSRLINPVYSEETQAILYRLVMDIIYKGMASLSGVTLFIVNNDDWTFIGRQAETVVREYWMGG